MPSEQVPAFLVHNDSTYDSIYVVLCISLKPKAMSQASTFPSYGKKVGKLGIERFSSTRGPGPNDRHQRIK